MHTVPFSQRSGERIEPLISLQWFMRMDELARPAIDVVRDGRVRIHPRVAGAALPRLAARTSGRGASRASCGGATSSRSGTAATRDLRRIEPPRGRGLGRATPTCSTRGSPRRCGRSRRSAGPTTRRTCARFYPTDVLSTARDILFLWVARMVMMGLRFAGDIPFDDVYVHSVIQAPDGRRMSKSLGTGHRPARRRSTAARRRRACASGCWRCPRPRTCASARRRSQQGQALANKLFNATRFVLLQRRRSADAPAPRPRDGRGPLDPRRACRRSGARRERRIDGFDFAQGRARALRLRLRRAVRLVPRARQGPRARRSDALSARRCCTSARDARARAPGDPVRDRGAVGAHVPGDRGPARGAAGRRARRRAARPRRRGARWRADRARSTRAARLARRGRREARRDRCPARAPTARRRRASRRSRARPGSSSRRADGAAGRRRSPSRGGDVACCATRRRRPRGSRAQARDAERERLEAEIAARRGQARQRELRRQGAGGGRRGRAREARAAARGARGAGARSAMRAAAPRRGALRTPSATCSTLELFGMRFGLDRMRGLHGRARLAAGARSARSTSSAPTASPRRRG